LHRELRALASLGLLTRRKGGRQVYYAADPIAEFIKRRRARDGFVQSVLKGPKIWLIGGEDDLAEPRKDRAAQTA
jgi:hypothetical protein